MKTRTRKSLGVAVVLAGVLAASSLSTSAYALDPADNTRQQTISDNPATNAHSCIERDISLTDHTYHWYLEFGSALATERTIYLAQGSYHWTDCLTYDAPHTYLHQSTLDPDATGAASAYLSELEYFPADNDSVTAYWGSTLIP